MTTAERGQDLSVLSDLAPELADMLVTVASDIALVVDCNGIIERVALGGSEPVKSIAEHWVGNSWLDTVTMDTRRKVEQVLADVSTTGISRTRQVNHPTPLGLDIPIAYSAIRLGPEGPYLAVGRDLSAISVMQQRLLQAQQEMERDYWQRRQTETRYQLLFQIATDAVLVVEPSTLAVVDANRAAARLFGTTVEQIIGKRATAPLAADSRALVESMLAEARGAGRATEGKASLMNSRARLNISVTPLRTDASTMLLMRLSMSESEYRKQQAGERMIALMGLSLDAIVICDLQGHIQMANPAFLDLAQIEGESAATGQPLGTWLGAEPGDIPTLLDAVRDAGHARRGSMVVRGTTDRLVPVELTVARLVDDDSDSFGFIIRTGHQSAGQRPSSADQPDPAVH